MFLFFTCSSSTSECCTITYKAELIIIVREKQGNQNNLDLLIHQMENGLISSDEESDQQQAEEAEEKWRISVMVF